MRGLRKIGSSFKLTSFLAVLASGDKNGALLGHVLTLAVVALHRLRALADHVRSIAAGADQRVGALSDEVALLLAVAAAGRGLVGALLGEVALLVAVTALNRCGRGRAVSFVVSISLVLVIKFMSMSTCGWVRSNIPNLAAVKAGAVAAASSTTALSTTVAVTVAVVEGARRATTAKVVVGTTGTTAEITTVVPRHLAGAGLECCQRFCGVMGQKSKDGLLATCPQVRNFRGCVQRVE